MKKKKSLILFQAITDMNEKFIEEAGADETPRRKKSWMPWAAAACLCLLIIGLSRSRLMPRPVPVSPETSASAAAAPGQAGIAIPPMKPNLSANNTADMIAFFIYQGRFYCQYEYGLSEHSSLAGEYLGTATGLIDEWTLADGYVELAGSVSGDFYSVNGYDPAFMLCMKENDGSLAIYICNNGITLQYGRELYEERLHLKENYQAVQYESRESWYYGRQDIHMLAEPENDTVVSFLDALNQAVFLPNSAICFQDAETPLYGSCAESEIWHVSFWMKDGTFVRLRLHEGGYVRFGGILDVCVRVPEDVFEEFCGLFITDSQ